MDTDRELLELAAKADGLSVIRYIDDGKNTPQHLVVQEGDWSFPWNPLTNDGDALRLLVTRGLSAHLGVGYVAVGVLNALPTLNPLAYELTDRNDPHAATRRAIVRAAAEIGRAMTARS